MGHGDETNRPHSKTVRTFKILRVSSQQCFLQVHDVQLRPFTLRSRVIVYKFSVFVVASTLTLARFVPTSSSLCFSRKSLPEVPLSHERGKY